MSASDRHGSLLLKVLIFLVILIVLFLLLLPFFQHAHDTSPRYSTKNSLKLIGLALHNYHDIYGSFPPAYTVDEQGNRLHSWRTLLLPYLDEEELYDAIDLTKPWDDPANAETLKTFIPCYSNPVNNFYELGIEHHTTFLGVASEGGFFQGPQARRLNEIADGDSKTWAVIEVEANHSVPWFSPYDAEAPYLLHAIRKGVLMPHNETDFHVLYAHGAVTQHDSVLPFKVRKAYLSIAGDDNSIIEEYENRQAGGTP